MIEIKTGTCSNCKQDNQLIVNKRHYLCSDCNRLRLDNQSGTKKEKCKALLQKVGLKRSTKPIKRFSAKREAVEKEYREVQQEIAHTRSQRCAGCHKTGRPLSYSHLIPRSLRSDLIACKENIAIHCLEWDGIMGCHEKWENGLWEGMKDLEENLKAVKELDINYYNKIINKFKKD